MTGAMRSQSGLFDVIVPTIAAKRAALCDHLAVLHLDVRMVDLALLRRQDLVDAGELLRRRVDLNTPRFLGRSFRDQVQAEALPLYEADRDVWTTAS